MKGTNQLTLNQETLAFMVQEYLNAHTFQKSVVVKSVREETVSGYGNSPRKEWIAIIEPKPEPVVETPVVDSPAPKAVTP